MAFQHHDPRYAQSPYHFQPAFPPPQQHNPAFGLGHPVAQPPLAPPQAYLTNRPQPPFPPHPQVAGQPGFPGTFPNAGQYQHNAQYNPNMVAGQVGMGYQNPQQLPPQFYNNRPFQNGHPPPPPTQMAAMSATSPSNAVPVPPAPLPQHNNNTSMQWPLNPGLPPKPPSAGYKESVELHSHSNPTQIQGGNLPGLGPPPEESGPSNGQSLGFNPSQQHNIAAFNANVSTDKFENRQHQSNHYPSSQEQTAAYAPYSPASPSVPNVSHADKDPSSHDNRAEESPDMYSPKLYPQDLTSQGAVAAPTRAMDKKGIDAHHSPPSEIQATVVPKGPTQHAKPAAAPVSPAIDPFAIKEKASQALRDLYANKISFLDIAGNGIHPNVLRNLYLELDLELDDLKAKQKESAKKATAVKESAKAEKTTVKPPASLPAPGKKATVVAPSKPLTREEYLAKLKAAKGDKAASPRTSKEPSPPPKSGEVVTIGSDTATSATPEVKETSPKPPPAKKVDLKSKEQNALIRQRLEALKRSTLEKQQKEAQAAAQSEAATVATSTPKPVQVSQANKASLTRSNGEYTPANPFFASTSSFSGLPGLSMFEDASLMLPGFSLPGTEDEEDEEGEVQEHGEILDSGETAVEIDVPVDEGTSSPNSHKRSYDTFARSETIQSRPQIDHNAQSQVVIELSDDEDEEGEVMSTLDRPALQRQLSGSSAVQDQGQRAQIQARLDALAAHEESIRLYKQKIELLEAKKRAKKAVGSNPTPTPSGTPSQTRPLSQIPDAPQTTAPSTALAAAGEKVQAQQDSFVATKSALVQRLEKEEAREIIGESTPRKNQREQRIHTLRASIARLDLEIAQAETEKQRIQLEIERGIQGRAEFSKELSDLLAEMEAVDVAADPISESPLPDVSDKLAEVEEEHMAEAIDDDNDDAGDDTMDISEDEGEITDDEDRDAQVISSPEKQTPSHDEYDPKEEEVKAAKVSATETVSQDTAAEETYSPHLESSTPGSDDVEMEYEPDEYDIETYEPEDPDVETYEPEDLDIVEDGEIDGEQDNSNEADENEDDYDPQKGIQEGAPDGDVAAADDDSDEGQHTRANPFSTSREVVTLSDSDDSEGSGKDLSEEGELEEGEMAEDETEDPDIIEDGSHHEQGDSGTDSVAGDAIVHNEGPDAQISAQPGSAQELAPSDQLPEENEEAEEVLMEESSESEDSADEMTT